MKPIGLAVAWFLSFAGVPGFATEPLVAERYFTETLGAPSPYWALVNDTNFLGYLDGKVFLFDGDTGRMLGMISTGGYQNAVEIAPDFSAIYAPVTYYTRHSRGERTDAVVIYETKGLTASGEIVIPPKRATGIPQRAYSGLSDDGRFVYVSNMTPASSISVVDVANRTFAGEIETAGCALIYPTGPRSLATLCGDGTLQTIVVDDAGKLATRDRTTPFFDPNADPVTEKASRWGDTWLFVSFEGYVHPVEFASGAARPVAKWSLFTDAERRDGWRVGGAQFTAVHAGRGLLYVIVHRNGPELHKNPGEVVWVYDLAERRRSKVIEIGTPISIIAVSGDDAPLLFATTPAGAAVYVHDALTGARQRVIEGGPSTPGFVQLP